MPNVSRLARGYVRQELRPLKKSNGLQVGYDFFKAHQPLIGQYFVRNKRLPERSPQEIVDSMTTTFLPQLLPVGAMPKNLEFQGLRAKSCKQVNALYWEAHEHAITNMGKDGVKEYDDDTVDLRFTRFCVDRKRLILDDVAVPVSVSEHALGRMSERGYSEDAPLATLSTELDKWLPLSFAFLFAAIHLKKVFGIGIPVGDGFLLGSVVGQAIRTTNPEDNRGDWMLARRTTYDNRGFYVTQPPRYDFFKIEEDKTVLLRLNTFISGKQLKWEQEWARDRILSIMQKHASVMPCITEMIIEGRVMDSGIIEGVKELLVDLVGLIEDNVWEDAIRPGN